MGWGRESVKEEDSAKKNKKYTTKTNMIIVLIK